jgi:hypothetical protein
MSFTITGPGEYRMRNGKKAVVEFKLKNALAMWPWKGLINSEAGMHASWMECGAFNGLEESDRDIVGPWVEPTPRSTAEEVVADLANALCDLLGHGYAPEAQAQARRAIAKADAFLGVPVLTFGRSDGREENNECDVIDNSGLEAASDVIAAEPQP